MSLEAVALWPKACSGERYWAVPRTWPVWVRGAVLTRRAMPKSVSLTVPSGVTRMLAGLTSRWTTPTWWAASSATASILIQAAAGDALGQVVTVTQDRAWGGVHGFSTASMTWRAIGAATLPPNASLPAFPPFSTTTATATFGSLAGANAVNQACGLPPLACWAVPVLPATSMPEIWAEVPVPDLTTVSIIRVRAAATSGLIACESCSGWVWSMTSRLLFLVSLTRYGFMTVPLLAMAALTIAICRGVTRTSYWPMAACAVCGALSGGTTLGVTLIGTRRESPKPNLAACARRASPPRLSPSQPNAVLQEISRACVRVVLLFVPHGRWSSVGKLMVDRGRSSVAGPGILDSSVNLPEDSAAAAVTSLKVEPGG